MTLGNDAAPLTRRQARELAQSQAAAATAQAEEQPVAKPAPERKKPTDRKPSEKGAAAKAAAAAEKVAADKAQAEADAAQADVDRAATEQAEAERVRAADTADTTDDRTLTRRELRAVVAARLAAEAAASGEAAADADDVDAIDTAAVTIVSDAPAGAVPPPATSAVPRPAPAVVAPAAAPEPLAPVPAPIVRSASAPAVAPTAGRPAPAVDSTPAAESRLPGLHPPLGHWSVDLDDAASARPAGRIEPFDDLMARGYGAGGIPTTTNALILPSVPNQGAVSGPLADSGEILITGSFDLPRSLGSTGQIPSHFDSSELDHMLDRFDDDGAPNAAEPVKASRAVSTHGSDRNVMEPPKRHLASVPIVLAVTTAALALGVVALFVGGYLLNIF